MYHYIFDFTAITKILHQNHIYIITAVDKSFGHNQGE